MTFCLGRIVISMALLVFCAGSAYSQGQQFKVGDKVEILNLSQEWVPGTVIGVLTEGTLYYRVKLDDENASTVYFNHVVPAGIRAKATAAPPTIQGGDNQPPNGGGGTVDQGLVDVYYNATQGWNRGTVVSTNGNRVTVRFIGCSRDEVVDRSQIHTPAVISTGAEPVTFLFGRWALTKVGTSQFNTAWGKADGIQVNGDGTYIWYQGAGKQPVRGHWKTDAKVPGTDSGTQFYDGILIQDAMGLDWKVFKWVVRGYPDGIQVQRMCSGEAIVGSRAK